MSFNAAMDKVRDEMAGVRAFSPVAEVGEMVTEMLRTMTGIAPAIMVEGRTLQGAYKAIEAAARKKGGREVCIGPTEATKIIREYYGITDAIMEVQTPALVPASPAPKRDEFDLDAMLGGL